MMVSKCDLDQVQAVGDLYDEVTAFLAAHVNYPHWRHKLYPSLEYARKMAQDGSLYRIEREGTLVGAFVLNEDPQGRYANVEWSVSLMEGEYMVIHALAVHPDHLREGIAREAVEYAIDLSRTLGFKALLVDVVPTNTPARLLYESLGFAYRGDVDLERGFEDIPFFSMYELILA